MDYETTATITLLLTALIAFALTGVAVSWLAAHDWLDNQPTGLYNAVNYLLTNSTPEPTVKSNDFGGIPPR